jgi:uncharacterized protein (TIGR02453 family)
VDVSAGPYFTPELFRFLAELAAHNERAWFEANKGRYRTAIQEPLLRFIVAFAPALKEISPHFVADPRPQGGSMFRIHRDVRFAADKSPYKTHAAAQFRHRAGKDVHAPGFYLHLEPGGCFVGVGIWHPDGPALAAIRGALVADPAGWTSAVGDRAFARVFTLGGDALKRPPQGFDPAHPLIDDLKRKDFVAMAPLSEEQAMAPELQQRFTSHCRAAAPFMRYLATAIGQPF